MKRVTIFIVLIASFFTSVFALPINECKTDIYFGNGIMNSSESAKGSAIELEERIIKREIIKGNPALQAKYGEVKLQYNWSYGVMWDVFETYYQLKEAGQVNDLEFFMVMMIIAGGDVPLSTYATGVLRESMPFVAVTEQKDVDKMLTKYYDESFKYSHRVLLVSHSQGNLFANRVYDSINPSGYKDYFANVQVASPASSVHATNGAYVTGLVDPIINPIPGSMSYNGVLDLSGGHAFVGAYLDSADTYDRIVTGIKAQLDNLDKTDSQWSTDREYDKNTCDYKITVKHRFDRSMEMAEKVYPFNTAKKLYSVNGQYVKASCGGKNILSAWEGKENNECWMIDNPQKETIVKANDSVAKLYVRYDYRDYIEGCSGEGFTGSIGFTNSEFKFLNRSCDGYGSGGRCTSDAEGRMEYILNLTPKENKNFIAHNLFRTLECILTQHNKTYDDVVAIRKGGIRREVYNGGGKIYVEYLIDFK